MWTKVVALLSCCALLGVAALPFEKQNPASVVVVGGGIAGLKTAAMLHEAGFNVTLLEANARVGGRTFTLKLGDGRHLEMGGEWIHGQVNNSIFELVAPLGLVMDELPPKKKEVAPFEYGNMYGLQTGEVLNSRMKDLLERYLDYVWFDPEGWGEDSPDLASMGEWARWMLERFNEEFHISTDPTFLEAVYDWVHRSSNAEESATSWFEVSASDEGEQYIWLDGHSNVRWKPPYSYASLAELILTGNATEEGIYDLPEWVKLSTPVTNIAYGTNQETVNVTTMDGTVYTADHVVWTGSLGVLKSDHATLFTPNLRVTKVSAIENIGFGTVSKINLEFSEPWWPSDFEGLFTLWTDHNYTDSSLDYWRPNMTDDELMAEDPSGLPVWVRSILSFHNVDSGSAPNVFRTWTSGNPGRFLDFADDTYIQEKVMETLHRFLDPTFPNITEPVAIYKTFWSVQPYFKGAYSYRTVAADVADVWARDLMEPVVHLATTKPLVCFAGEATHPNYFATVHGAYDTGVREAERIMAFYK